MHQSYRAVSDALAHDALAQLGSFMASDPSPDQVKTFMSALSDQYGSASASAAATYYDDTRAASEVPGNFRAQVATPITGAQLDSSTGWALYGPGKDVAGKLSGVAQRLILSPGRETVLNSVRHDPAHPRWARVPDASACGFCRMLSSRGAVYASKQTAEFHAHDRCGCHPEVLFKGAKPSYDADALYQQYVDARRASGSSDPKAIAAAMEAK